MGCRNERRASGCVFLPERVGVRRPGGECGVRRRLHSVDRALEPARAISALPGCVIPTTRGATVATEEVELETADPAESNVDEVVADDLVEDVSIDGMCGVY
ncbi:hypothetical protein GCM10027572_19280 [Flexivirga lutea]